MLSTAISTNVRLQLTSTLASASVDVPDMEPLTSGGTRAEERERATQQLCSLLDAGFYALLLNSFFNNSLLGIPLL
jgi:hypothetical protein